MADKLNIFERVAETLREEQSAAFINNPSSTKYFSINYATEPKKIGRKYPQSQEIIGVHHSLKFDDLPAAPINFGSVYIHNSSKLTDFISTTAIAAHAFIISKKAIETFEQFDLGDYKVHPATVIHKGIKCDYGVLQFTNDLHSNIDFANSKFYVANILGGYEFDIDVNSLEDYEAKRNEVKQGLYPGTKKWWYLNLKWGEFLNRTHTPNIFTIFSSAIKPYISQQLAMAILENGLTGIEIERVYNLSD
jgi:hypothetical protein